MKDLLQKGNLKLFKQAVKTLIRHTDLTSGNNHEEMPNSFLRVWDFVSLSNDPPPKSSWN